MDFRRLVIVLSGPSGVGKQKKIEKMLSLDPKLEVAVSATTREPRQGEVNGRDYYFMTRDQFEELAWRGQLLEYEENHGHLYGTPRASIESVHARGMDAIIDVDVRGAMSIKRVMPDAITVFIYPRDLEQLREHLEARGTEDEAKIAKRLARAPAEMEEAETFDYVIHNGDYAKADGQLYDLICANRLRPTHPLHFLHQVPATV